MKQISSLLAIVALALTAGACATPQSGTKVADTQSAEQPEEGFDGHERLAEEVVPTRYRLALDLDPTRDMFSGTTSIQVELAEEVDRIDLHAKDLDIDRVWANVGKAKIDASVLEGTNGGITVVLDSSIGPGEATLEFEYQAPLDETPHGLYRVQEDGRWYAFTQFEPLSAREAFPSFDEPRFKTPFEVSIEVGEGDQKAFANTLPENIRDEDGSTYVFEETEPLPTYLVAFAAGPLEVVEAPEDAIPGVPLRVITTQGKSHLAAYALDKAPALLAAQTDYFGMELPFSKLDMVAVPNFAAGAMENVGLVTFRERLLLLDPDNATASDEYALQSVMAHEFAHMWFGNYVTPAWWNDLWLNEAFATWMATRTLAEVAPEFEPRIDAVRGSLRVMSADALENARAIRQPIRSGGDVYNAFDGITYSKGRAVLQMLEAWMGEEAFRDGVRRFMDENAYGTGTTEGLISAWEEVSDKPIEAMLGGFLDQPGVPLVEVEPSCKEGKTSLEVAQSRYLPAGSDAEADKTWRIPVCFGFAVDGEVQRRCELIEEASQTVEFDTESCPTWIHPNADGAGYYHWKLPAEDLVELGSTHRDQLSMPERVALLPHTKALVEAHTLDVDAYLALVEAMAEEEHRAIVGQVVDAVSGIEEIAREQDRGEAFENWAAEIILPHAWRLGFEAKDGEPVEDRLLRPKVIRAAAELIPNDELRLEAVETAERYLNDPSQVPLSEAKTALRIAAHIGDEPLWEQLKQAIAAAPNPSARAATIAALGHFRDPELVERSLDLFLTDTLRAQDFWTVMGPALGEPKTREVAWNWLEENYDAVADKLGDKSAPSLPWVGSAFCSEEKKQEVEAFFGDEDRQGPGQARNLAKALESISRCVNYRAYVADDVRAFLADQ